ncbi:MAG: DUF1638 domain-containing protein [Anaerolineae bacterium]|nr:DUF1638 domain-containing protein [Anaerolineae bacterium]
MAYYTALTCEALARSVYDLAASSPQTITVSLFKQGLHNHPRNLRMTLQSQIDCLEPCDAILLAYGICGTATIGLTARHTPLVIPRVHDCIALYLGSHECYQKEFDAHPGTFWYSTDYMERQDRDSSVALGAVGITDVEANYDQYVLKFGQEIADQIITEMRTWSQHYTRAAFIDTRLGNPEPFEKVAQDKAAREGWIYTRIESNRRLLKLLLDGDWSEDEFLMVLPGHRIEQSYRAGLIKAVRLE